MTIFLKKNLRAFTLIEVMVVMAIISVMSGMVIVSLTDSRVKRELETNAREFAGVVREAQNYALTGKQLIPDTTPTSYGIQWTDSAPNYSLLYNGVSFSNYTLKNGVTFSSGGNLSFSLPHANFNGSTSVKFTKKAIYHTVCISSDGRTSDQPGDVICP